MNTEQERAEFEAWYRHHHGSRDVYALDESGEYVDKQVQGAFNVWQARAALQSQPQKTIAYLTRNEEGDPAMLFFDLKEARLYCNPDEEPEALVLAVSALQSQEREDAVQAAIKKLSEMTPRPPKAITYDQGWKIIDMVQRELCPAIDHARRAEGDGE